MTLYDCSWLHIQGLPIRNNSEVVGFLSPTVQSRFQGKNFLCPQVVEKGGPYPLIILPQFGGYWIEDPENVGTPTSLGSSVYEEEEEDSLSPNTFGYKLECRGEARAYRRHFLGKVSPGTLPEWTLHWGGWHGSLFQGFSVFSASCLSLF